MSASNVLQDLQIHMESKDGGGAEGRGVGGLASAQLWMMVLSEEGPLGSLHIHETEGVPYTGPSGHV